MKKPTISKYKFPKKQVEELNFPKQVYLVKRNGRVISQTNTKRQAEQIVKRYNKK